MKAIIYIFSVSLLFAFWSCENSTAYIEPQYLDGSMLDNTTLIPEQTKNKLEGIYSVITGNDYFGKQLVLKWQGSKLAIFGSKEGSYFLLSGGEKDSVLLFEGTWKKMTTLETGLTRLKIDRNNGSINLMDSSGALQPFKISGSFGFDDNPNQNQLQLEYLRPFSDDVKNSNFLILAHRGGGRNSEQLGASENSVEIIAKAEQFGANGIEIDIKLSKDNVPILYHDVNVNLRLTQESPIQGHIEDFTFSQIRTFIRLTNGERIPSLHETLDFVLEHTTLKFVWLDMKSDRNSMPYVIPIQEAINQRAKDMGRDLLVAIGLPSEEMREHFISYPGFENIPSINEGSTDEVHKTNSYVWAPTWTQGPQTDLVRKMHEEGRIAITWTLDQGQFISKFINESKFDGVITNYPTIVAYYHYAK
jgi:glycerophosphoryl diester phosphodiesterase